jgi:acetyl-CoA acetyltransferase
VKKEARRGSRAEKDPMEEVVIVSAVRTAVGRLGGGLRDVEPEDLGKVVIREALRRASVGPAEVDEVILGQTKQSADAANLARVAALKAGDAPVRFWSASRPQRSDWHHDR